VNPDLTQQQNEPDRWEQVESKRRNGNSLAQKNGREVFTRGQDRLEGTKPCRGQR